MKILSIIKDERINATSVLVEMPTEAYLKLVSGAEDNLEIQRKVIKGFKPYDRLRQDLKEGCLIPPVVLGIRKDRINTPENANDDQFISSLKTTQPGDVFIIDGLQRTTAIQNVRDSLQDEELTKFLTRPLRVEVWPRVLNLTPNPADGFIRKPCLVLGRVVILAGWNCTVAALPRRACGQPESWW